MLPRSLRKPIFTNVITKQGPGSHLNEKLSHNNEIVLASQHELASQENELASENNKKPSQNNELVSQDDSVSKSLCRCRKFLIILRY